MTSKLLGEELLSLSQAARGLPHLRGRPVAPSTLWRWAKAGVNGVRLETFKYGCTTCTSRQAIERFLGAINAEGEPAAPARDHEAVEAELDLALGAK